MNALRTLTIASLLLAASHAAAVDNLLANPGFRDVDMDGGLGDGWTNSGDVYFFSFWGDNPHASLFADTIFHEGRLEQLGIPATPGTTYQFDLTDVRIEANFSPDLRMGLEYYDAADVKLGETIVGVDYVTRRAAAASAGLLDSSGAVNGAVFSVQGTAVPGAVTVRPIVQYDNVQTGGNQANAFVFNTHLAVAPGVGDEALKNPGFEDTDQDGGFGDYWRSYGNAGFHNFFAGGGAANGHASLFGDMAGNFGGIWQQSTLATPGAEYEFSLLDVRIESNVNGNFRFGFEFFGDDDTTKLGESIVPIDLSTKGDGLTFTTSAVAIPGAKYIRPIVQFDNVTTTSASDAGVFVFDASLIELPASTDDSADFNGDSVVDGADLLIWQRNFGMSAASAGGDANNDSFVDAADLAVWRSQFGASPSAAAIAAVPEPASGALLVALAAGAAITRRRALARIC